MPTPFYTKDNPINVGESTTAFAVEYRIGGVLNHASYHNMPCSLCETTGQGNKIMIHSHCECPDGWHKEYNGYIMAGHESQNRGSMYYCIDENMEQVKGSRSCDSVHLFYLVGASRPLVSTTSYALSCVVCTYSCYPLHK